MDGVLVDFKSGIDQISDSDREKFQPNLDDVPGIFSKMLPVDGAIESYAKLSKHFDVYILSTAPWKNPSAWSDKLNCVKKHLGEYAEKRLILSHHKNLNRGDYLIDDRTAHGVDDFKTYRKSLFGNNLQEIDIDSELPVIYMGKPLAVSYTLSPQPFS